MPALKVFSYPACGTCKKALAFLKKNEIEHEVINIVESPPEASEIKAMLNSYQGNLKKLFNTSGEVYRTMRLGSKLPSMDQSEAIKLLAAHGKLIKRPFVLGKDVALVGFDESEWGEKMK
jgi:Spx/MgsR family transcriptional regulator